MELCYISSVGKCFIPEINGQFARCNSTFNLLVAGQMIAVSFYEIIIGTGIGKSVVHMEVSSSDYIYACARHVMCRQVPPWHT